MKLAFHIISWGRCTVNTTLKTQLLFCQVKLHFKLLTHYFTEFLVTGLHRLQCVVCHTEGVARIRYKFGRSRNRPSRNSHPLFFSPPLL